MMVLVVFCMVGVEATLKYDFYEKSCPNVERIVFESMRKSFNKDKTVAPGVLRLIFHDCFVRGCDASVLLAGTTTERAAANNVDLHGFEAIDAAKEAVEEACPGVVSCADILAFASRDTVKLTKGNGWSVPAGRRDGTVSLSSEPLVEIPPATFNASQLVASFRSKGLTAQQMVDLSGSHTIGVTHCLQLRDRIFTVIDPTLPKDLLRELQRLCPTNVTRTPLVIDRATVHRFDTQYYRNIANGRGLMTSDQTLYASSQTRPFVVANLEEPVFFRRFAEAMVAMTNIQPKVGREGEIRKHCQYVN
jgi:peroxidase